jgi:hypothetical protein
MLFVLVDLLLAFYEFLHFGKLVRVQLIALNQTHEKGFDGTAKHTIEHVAGCLAQRLVAAQHGTIFVCFAQQFPLHLACVAEY